MTWASGLVTLVNIGNMCFFRVTNAWSQWWHLKEQQWLWHLQAGQYWKAVLLKSQSCKCKITLVTFKMTMRSAGWSILESWPQYWPIGWVLLSPLLPSFSLQLPCPEEKIPSTSFQSPSTTKQTFALAPPQHSSFLSIPITADTSQYWSQTASANSLWSYRDGPYQLWRWGCYVTSPWGEASLSVLVVMLPFILASRVCGQGF